MDPISVFAVATGASDVLKTVRIIRSALHNYRTFEGVQRILSETEILSAMTFESASMLDSLASSPPRSAEVALRQCEDNAMHLKYLIDDRLPSLEGGKNGLSKRNKNDKDIKADMEDALDAFRVSAGLLRQVAAE